jgi:hypothetical protein
MDDNTRKECSNINPFLVSIFEQSYQNQGELYISEVRKSFDIFVQLDLT